MFYHSALWKHKRKVQGVRRCGVLRCQFTVHFLQLASWWTGAVEVATQRLSSCWSHCRGRTARHHTTPLSAKMLSFAVMSHEIEEMLLSFANLISFDLTCITNHTWDIDPARPWRDWSGESSCKSFPGEPWDRELELLLFSCSRFFIVRLHKRQYRQCVQIFSTFANVVTPILPSSQQVWLWC